MQYGEGVIRFLTCGSVDDGKSTLIGHLLQLTGNLYEDQLRMLASESARQGASGESLDYALLLDGLASEREQGITIDVAHRFFEIGGRKYIAADTPGHETYVRNMATGASRCSAALILLDARLGVLPQTRRHFLICLLMGIRDILFAVNKMDLIGENEQQFRKIESDCLEMVRQGGGFTEYPCNANVIPVSALYGDNLVTDSPRLHWFNGTTVLEWLQALKPVSDHSVPPLRLPVQFVLSGHRAGGRFQGGSEVSVEEEVIGSTWRSYAGTIISGELKRGDRVVVLPSGIETRIDGLYAGADSVGQAGAGMAVSVRLEGQHDVVRGDCLAHPHSRPEQSDLFRVRLVWMSDRALHAGRRYLFRSLFGTVEATVTRIRYRIGLETFEKLSVDSLETNDIGEVELSLTRRVMFDPFDVNRETGSFILIDREDHTTVACGMVRYAMRRAANIHRHEESVGRVQRSRLKGQQPCVIWLTGLSGSGKSTLANRLESKLHEMGRHTMLLDGDNIRHGLNRDLGFTEADRIENIRRIGEVARLMADAGLIVITAFISPYRSDRQMVRSLFHEGEFFEIHLSTPLDVCEGRDPKGLYRQAREGRIPNFTGITSPYEAPLSPELRLDTSLLDVEQSLDRILSLPDLQPFLSA
ncbi:MAG: adenylyl-sulfate kinase [Chlorobiaceae bacterium]|nr:adenylyl-sulfate kinase [Chlorobiaceae bacterium]